MSNAEWITARLGDVANINMGQSPPSSAINDDGPGLPFIQGNAEFGPRYPRPVKVCTQPKKQARGGDILMSVRAPVGDLNLADQPLCIGRGLSAITATNIETSFLWHALRRKVNDLARVSQGSTFAAVKKADLYRLELPLPPLPEQRKIAAILSAVDDAIEKTRAVIDQVQVVKRGLMQELLTRGLPGRHTRFKRTEIGPIPQEWRLKRLSEVANVQTGLAKNKANAGPLSVSYLRVANVQDGFVDLSEVKAIGVNADALSRYALRPGDVLFTEGGDADKLGRGAVWNGEIEPCLHQNHVFVARSLGTIRPLFLSLYRGSSRGKSYFLNCSKQTTNLASMNSTQLKNLPLPVPRLDEQDRIVECLGAFDDRLSQEEECLKELDRLKSALMSILLTGELRVTPDTEST